MNNYLATCSICSDKRHYETTVYAVQNILHRLNILAKNYTDDQFTNEDYRLRVQLSMDGKHPHFMCGTCVCVNTSELKNLEDKIDTLLVKIARNITKEDVSFYNVLRLLQGEYSGKYHIFEQCINKKGGD